MVDEARREVTPDGPPASGSRKKFLRWLQGRVGDNQESSYTYSVYFVDRESGREAIGLHKADYYVANLPEVLAGHGASRGRQT